MGRERGGRINDFRPLPPSEPTLPADQENEVRIGIWSGTLDQSSEEVW